jgi:hypothetical protein
VLTRENILSVLKEYKEYFDEQLGVRTIGLFGSYAKGMQKESSDVDIFIDIQTPDYNSLLEVLEILESRLHRKIDIVRSGPHLDEKFLHQLKKEIIYA